MTASSTSAIEPVINLLSFRPLPAKVTALTADDWETTVVTALALGLGPLLHHSLSQQTEVNLPPMAMAKLAVTRQAHAKRNQAIAAQLAEILEACALHGIEGIVLKGALLAPTMYDDPALRPMNDIDLLFHPEDLSCVAAMLAALGYRGKYKSADRGPGVTKHLSTYRRDGHQGATPNPYLSAGGERTVEPHHSLEESWFGLKVDITPGIWQRAVPVTLQGQPAYRLSTADMLLHLAVHATFHVIMGRAVFLQLYDLGQVLKTWPAEVDWDNLLALAREAEAEPFLYAALYWTKDLYHAPVPPEPLQKLEKICAPPLVTYIQSLNARQIFERTQQPPLVTLGQRLKRGVQDRWETARWAGSWGEKWRVWQTVLAIHKTDTAALLPKLVKGRS
jgi:hypothetical protein